jgi:hypothetical protein
MLRTTAMPVGLLISVAFVGARAQPQAEVEAEKASEAKGLLRPIKVQLDFRDRTLVEIVDGINAQGPKMLAIDPKSNDLARGAYRNRRFTLRAPEPLSFWEAVDRVACATETRPVEGKHPDKEFRVVLVPATRDRGFGCNDGAFRIAVSETSYERNIQLAPLHQFERPIPGVREPSDQTYLAVHLVVLGEPRFWIRFYYDLVIREAIDERGRSLIPTVPWRLSLKDAWQHRPNDPEAAQVRAYANHMKLAIPLKLLDDPGKRIKRLRGSASVGVAPGPGPEGSITPVEFSFDFADIPLP